MLTSLLAENNGGQGAFQVLRQSVAEKVVLKDQTIAECRHLNLQNVISGQAQ